MGLIFNKPQKGAYEFNSLAVTEDADGRMRLWAYAPSGCTKKTPVLINFSPVTPFGYMAQLGSLATATGAYSWVGIPEGTLASGGSGMFQIGGIASNVVWGASVTGSAGVPVMWSSASGLVSGGASCSSSLWYRLATGTAFCGAFCYAQSGATTTHDLFLFGQQIVNCG
jgi:hypothetical protein